MPALQYSKEKKSEAATSDQDLSLVASIRKLAPVSLLSHPSVVSRVATR